MMIDKIEDIYAEILAISEKIESMQYACTHPDSAAYESKLKKIRIKVLDLIEWSIKFFDQQEKLTLWEKNYFKKALFMFSINLDRNGSRAWLQNCLNYIYLATAEPEEIIEKEIEPKVKEEINNLQAADFLAGIEKIRDFILNETIESNQNEAVHVD